MDNSINDDLSLRHLYPSLSGEELRVASENIDRYLNLVLRICKRIEAAESIKRSNPWGS